MFASGENAFIKNRVLPEETLGIFFAERLA